MDGHSSGMCVATHLARPTRTAIRKRIRCGPYLVLLPVGLALPLLLPGTRCALTAPFQPCRGFRPVGGVISVALSLGSPPPAVNRHRFSVEPGLSSNNFLPAVTRPSDGGSVGDGALTGNCSAVAHLAGAHLLLGGAHHQLAQFGRHQLKLFQ